MEKPIVISLGSYAVWMGVLQALVEKGYMLTYICIYVQLFPGTTVSEAEEQYLKDSAEYFAKSTVIK